MHASTPIGFFRVTWVFGVFAIVGWVVQAEVLHGRLTPTERADPLEPWSLERVPEAEPLPGAPIEATDFEPTDAIPGAPETAVADSIAGAIEIVSVVRFRQLLFSHPVRAASLAELLRLGVPLERARKIVHGVELAERMREYAVDELDPEIRDEVDSLPEGGWSRMRRWRGRSSMFQVVAKEERDRGSLPRLGEGLDKSELDRLKRIQNAALEEARAQERAPANLYQDRTRTTESGGGPPDSEIPAPAFAPEFEPAALVEKEEPEYPPLATMPGKVTVSVQLDLVGNVIDVRVVESTDPIFEEAAIRAARRSEYRAATRNGAPEQSTVTIEFQFLAPEEP